jgi:LmbE family N-acetylglucosaminyl deacetylase
VLTFVSPHLDDIALSCGGWVSQLRQRAEPVTVLTICTADTPVGVTLSEAARHVHWEWQLGEDNPYAARRAEDHAVCAQLGVTPVHLGFPDAVYRYNPDGTPSYTRNFIGGLVVEHDWRVTFFALVDALRQQLPTSGPVLLPLAIGGHVDHVLVRSAAETAIADPARLRYFEDYPYAQKVATGQLTGEIDVLTRGLRAETITLAQADIETRVAAIAGYRSQQFALFEDVASMPEKVRAYIAASGGERYYRRGV